MLTFIECQIYLTFQFFGNLIYFAPAGLSSVYKYYAVPLQRIETLIAISFSILTGNNVILYQLLINIQTIHNIKRLLSLISVLLITAAACLAQKSSKALLIIDIQNFYFPGGKMALTEPEKAAGNAAILLARFREKKLPVIHIRHNSEPGGKINEIVEPLETEKVITKNEINSFKGTGLNDYLKKLSVDTLVICGMQTHMCVEAAVRAGADLDYKVILVHDACTTRDLIWENKIVKAQDVHLSTLVTLKNYAVLKSTSEYLSQF